VPSALNWIESASGVEVWRAWRRAGVRLMIAILLEVLVAKSSSW